MNKLQTTLTAVAALLASTVANAAPIQFWDFTTVTVFGNSTFSAGGGTQDAVPGNTLVSWGAAGGDHTDNDEDAADSRSALEVTQSVVNGSMEIGGPAQDSGEVTHYNNAISSSFAFLTNTQIDTTLTLFPLPQPESGVFGPLVKVFSVNFIETFNEEEPEDCGFDSVSACDDIFVVELGDLDFSFAFGGYLYTVTIGRQGLFDLPDATCEEAGAAAGCFGVTTQEGLFTPVNFDLSIDAKLIPEPSALALLGIGLFGLGVARRRMSK